MARAPMFPGVWRAGTGRWQSYAAGRHHDIRGNVFDSRVQLFAGTMGGGANCTGCHGSDAACGPWAEAAHCALLVGNQGGGVVRGFQQNANRCGQVTSFNATTGAIQATFEGGPITGVRVYRAGIPFPVEPGTGFTRWSDDASHTISAGDGGFEYPGDGNLPSPAQLSETDVGWKRTGQNSNAP